MIEPIVIETLDDPRVTAYRNVRDADLRGGGGQGRPKRFIAESVSVVRRLLEASWWPESLLLSPVRLDELETQLVRLPQSVPVYSADERTMTQIAGYRIHGGALAVARRPEPARLTLDHALQAARHREHATLILCERITNVDNIGAMVRNAAAFSADGLLLDSDCADPLFRKAIRVSMGHIFRTPWAISDDWSKDLLRLRDEWGYTLVAAETAHHAIPLHLLPAAGRMAIIFGSEGQGVAPTTLERVDHVVEIPMAVGVPSLNVSVASAVFLYERQRQHEAE